MEDNWDSQSMVNGLNNWSLFENLNTSHHGALETDDNHLKRCPACWRKALKRQADENRGIESTNNSMNKNPNHRYGNSKQ